ncbi:NHL repeat-containing protein [Engelhardtia mirabilis]|uniref:Serine/threonine-protein kinase PknD n=1 Tax=Engelhardtia mirabilis TaxID=2528011 RepID=A0A518BMG8_9BACT|nr:Serine/threonine-protein kinase PknD [Planctomycetes bacterium Pla133]QDV02508.1 Serine/threonine-protein kinase PknD [Planctomycetes bacterium Pla86]
MSKVALTAAFIASFVAVESGAARAGELLVSNFTTGVVASFDPISGTPTGTLQPGVSTPAGMVVAPNGTLLVASSSGNLIRAYDGLCGTSLGVFASGGGLNQPRDLAFGPNGNLFVANRQGNNVLEFDGTTGVFVKVFASQDLSAPIGLAFTSDGNLLVTSLNTDKLVRFDGTTGAKLEVLPTGSELDGPVAILLRPNGNLLVSSSLNDRVLQYTPSGGFLGIFAQGSGLDNPIGLAFDGAGDLLVVSANSGAILRFDGTSGAFEGVLATPGPQPFDLAFGPDAPPLPTAPGYDVSTYAPNVPGPFVLDFAPDGRLFVGQQTQPVIGVNAFVTVVAPDGTHAPYGAAPTLDPDVVVYDAVGTVSGVPGSVIVGGICGTSVGCLHRIGPDQSVTQILGPTTELENPYNLEFDSQGRLICTDDTQPRLLIVGPGAGSVATLVNLPSPATGLAIDAADRIYSSNEGGTVLLHSSSGALLDGAYAQGLGPNPPLAIGPGGPCFGTFLYAIDPATGELLRLLPGGGKQVLGTGFANDQSDLTFGPDGALYVTQVCADRVVRIAPSSPAIQATRSGIPPNPTALLPGVTSGPVIGATWDPVISHGSFAPGALIDVLVVTSGPTNLPLPGFGTLLCDLAVTYFTATTAAGAPFAVDIPPTCQIVGLGLCTQGVSVDGVGGLLLTNALDIAVGTY